MAVVFKKAEKKKLKLKLGMAAPSGGGKTLSALLIAKGMGLKTAVIDTENNSASLYADLFDFDVCPLSPPYTTARYIEAINQALKEGYETIIVDSGTHQWSGEGSVLSRKEQLDGRGGNSFTNWGKFTPEQELFKSTILHCPAHLIMTVRAKQDYILADNGKGKQAPQKVGLAPIQREGMEYEFTVWFDIAMNHEAATSKDRTGLFVDKLFKINEDTGKQLLSWLDSGVEPEKELPPQPASPKQMREIVIPKIDAAPIDPDPVGTALRKYLGTAINKEKDRLGWSKEVVENFFMQNFTKLGPELSIDQLKLALETMERQP